MKNLNNKRTGTFFSFTNIFLTTVSGLILSSFLLKQLGDTEYGLYQTIAAFVNYLVVLEFGIGTVLCRNILVARNNNDNEKIAKVTSTLWWFSIVLSFIILFVGLFFYFNIKNIYSNTIPTEKMEYAQNIFLVMLFFLLVSFFSQALSGSFIGFENYNLGSIESILKTFFRTIFIIIAVFYSKSAIYIALVDAIIGLFLLLFNFVYAKKKYNYRFSLRFFDKSVLKDCMPMCFALLIQTVINQANGSVDKFIISIKIDLESVALYSVGMYIYSIFSSLTLVPISIFMPQVAKNISNGMKEKELEYSLISSGRQIAIIGGTILFGFIVVGRQFISILYGEEYTLAWWIALIVIVPMFINMTGGSMINVLDIYNKRQIRSYILLVTTIINIILTIILIEFWGIIGATVATGVSMIFGQIIFANIFYLKKFKMNIWRLYLNSFKGIVPAQIVALIFSGLFYFIIQNMYLSFFICGIIFVIIETLCLFTFGFNKNEKNFFRNILKKLLFRKK